MDLFTRNKYNASVVVTSDTCSEDASQDESGPYVVNQLKAIGFNSVKKFIVPDDKDSIIKCIKSDCLIDQTNVLIITIGGTGLCPRDVTPDATSVLYDKHCDGIKVSLMMTSLRYSAHAALSRLTAGIVNNCLIVNFPGKLKACKECFPTLATYLEHALEQINFQPDAIRATHAQQAVTATAPEAASTNSSSNDSSSSSTTMTESERDARLEKIFSKINFLKTPTALPQHNQTSSGPQASSASGDNLASTINGPKTQSPYRMIDYTEAVSIMRSLSGSIFHNTDFNIEQANSNNLIGRYLAEDLYSKTKIPPYTVSTMDGYVVYIPEIMNKHLISLNTIQVRLVDDLNALEKIKQDGLASFYCYQVNTGGRVPDDMSNFAVIPFEQTEKSGNKLVAISSINSHLDCQMYTRLPGIDLNSKDGLLKGTKIGVVEFSIILAMGYRTLKLVSRPMIGLFSTGDELVSFDQFDSKEDKVLDTNGPMLKALLESKNYEVLNFGISKDNEDEILEKIRTCSTFCDVIIITGGASMGTKDYVKDVIVNKLGGKIHFGRVNIKPGKPAALASFECNERGQKFIFSLPGNPVSAYMTTITLVVPFIEHGLRNHLGVHTEVTPYNDIGELITVELASIHNDANLTNYVFDGRLEFVRARIITRKQDEEGPMLKAQYLVSVSVRQQSSCLLSLLDCDCLIVINPNMKNSKFLVGQTYQALRLKY